MKNTRKEVYEAIDSERDYQDWRGEKGLRTSIKDEDKPLTTWILYMEKQLENAKNSVYFLNEADALDEIRKVTTLGVRAMEVHGVRKRVIPKNVRDVKAGY